MALSGSLNTSSYGSYGRYLTLSWTATQDVANNTSTVNWTLKGAGGTTTSYYKAGGFKVVINGVTVYSKGSDYRISLYNGTTVASGSLLVYHGTDGTKTFSASVEAAIYSTATNVSGSGSWTLNTIPRAAKIVTLPNFTDEDNLTFTYSNLIGNGASSLRACISLTGAAADIAYREISKTGTSYTFNLTDADREVLRNATTTAASRTVYLFLKTTINGTVYTDYRATTLTITNAKPTLSPVVEDTNTTTTALTGDKNKLIKYYSNAKVTTGATALKGATIKSVKITCGGKSLTANGTINAVESGTFTITATDSRGYSTTTTVTKTLINYIKPTCNLGNEKPLADGSLSLSVSGKCFKGSFGSTSNTLSIQYRLKPEGGSYSSWTSLSTTVSSSNTYSTTISKTGLDYKKTYTIQVKAVDAITYAQKETSLKALPIFDWSEEDFNFNVPVKFNSTPMVDFIVDEGTSGSWTYRKWTSGIAECWARVAVSTTVNTTWGGLYVSGSLSATNISFPFTFTAIPSLTVTLSGSGAGAFLVASGTGSTSTTKTGIYEIARGSASSTSSNYAINYHAIGRWK